jgi:hypothetical protein
MPTATPTWRNVSLIPLAIPLRSFGTTLIATSAITTFTSPVPAPAIAKPGSSAVQASPASRPPISRIPTPTSSSPTLRSTRAGTRVTRLPAAAATKKLASVTGRYLSPASSGLLPR